MASSNPVVNAPSLNPSARRSLHSRSTSRSPLRSYQPREHDPILRDLSPTTTLRAFAADTHLPTGSQQEVIARCLDNVSSTEKALGIKAAEACLNLRSWAVELEAWYWPGTFDVPEPARKKMRMSYMSYGSLASPPVDEQEEEEHWGSLPAAVVQNYEHRLGEIGDDLEDIDLEEMKQFVLEAHNQVSSSSASIDDSIGMIAAATDLRRLDDFTAIVTATILHALPFVSRVNYLLGVWSLRVRLLRSAPAYLYDLKEARTDLDHGWAAIAVAPSSAPGSTSAVFGKGNMIEMQSMIEAKVSSLGRRLDGFLDELEGREETVPDAWIDDFESLETAYGDWVVQAERRALENEWRKVQSRKSSHADEGPHNERIAKPASDNGELAQADVSGPIDMLRKSSRTSSPTDTPERSSRTTSPTTAIPLALFTGSKGGSEMSFKERNTSPDKVQQPTLGTPIELLREDSQTLPQPNVSQGNSTATLESGSSRHSDSTMSPFKRSRHTPIVLHHDGDGQEYSPQAFAGAMSFMDSHDTVQEPPTTEHHVPGAHNVLDEPASRSTSETSSYGVKSHAAFLDRNTETNKTLQMQSRSPVRSFEHASNAFTRLFQKNKPPEGSGRSSAASSIRSSGRAKSLNLKSSNSGGIVWGGRQVPSPTSSGKRPSFVRGRSHSAGANPTSTRASDNDVRRASVNAPEMPPLPQHLTKTVEAEPPSVTRETQGYYTPRPQSIQSRRSGKSSSPREPAFPTDWPLVSPEKSPSRSESSAGSQAEQGRIHTAEHERQHGDSEAFQEELEHLTPEGDYARSISDASNDSDGSLEIHSPRKPLESDAFHSMFVDSFPPEEDNRLVEPFANTAEDVEPRRGRSGPRHKPTNVPTLEDGMLDPMPDMSPDPSIVMEQSSLSSSTRHERFGMPHTPGSGRERGSVQGELYTPLSNDTYMSSPEVKEAVSMDYFQVSPIASRTGSRAAFTPQRHGTVSPVSPMIMKFPEPRSSMSGEPAPHAISNGGPSPVKRASLASIGSFPRSELREVDVNRANSVGSMTSGGLTPRLSLSGPVGYGSGRNTPTTALNFGRANSHGASDSESGSRQLSSGFAHQREILPGIMQSTDESVSPSSSQRSMSPDFGPESTATDTGSIVPPAPLNIAMAKRRNLGTGSNVTSDGPSTFTGETGTSHFEIPPTPLGPPPKSEARQSPLKPGEDTFDRHVSDVLSNLPSTSSIRFKPRPGAKTPEPSSRTAEPRSHIGPRPKPPFARPGTSHGMTIVPAEATPSRRSKPSDPEVKLYHLTQAGRDEPIKLFVRLVGEGERVMVRVGGGWADLAEYLRGYAEHHPRRTLSEGLLEVNTDVPAVGGPGRRVSGPVNVVADANKHHRTPAGNKAEVERPSSKEGELASPTSPISTVSPALKPLPGRYSNYSRPTTPRPGSRQSNRDPAAAESANALNEQKARWVDGMLLKAKKANSSGEKMTNEDKNKHFGEMGKVGGTRRLVFKGAE